jgi:hypothetical protein
VDRARQQVLVDEEVELLTPLAVCFELVVFVATEAFVDMGAFSAVA